MTGPLPKPLLPVLAVAIAIASTVVVQGRAGGAPAPIPYDDARLIIEVNATDGDAGLQVFADADAWRRFQIYRPDGQRIVDLHAEGPLSDYGLTELFSESSEPPFDEFPLSEFKKLFPAGTYQFRGVDIEGQPLASPVVLSHDIPNGPPIVFPTEGAVVPRDDVVVQWKLGPQPAGVEVVRWQVLVVREGVDPVQTFSVDLRRGARRVTVPVEFLRRGTDYKAEVLAIEASGNQTLTEVDFETAG